VSRQASLERVTRETRVSVALSLDGRREVDVQTGIGFYDHLLTSLAFHAGFDLQLRCDGDLHVDDHHTVEDSALVLGEALRAAAGNRVGIARFASAYAPLDEALARAVVDVSGRPWAEIDLGLRREQIGTMACENVSHALRSLAQTAGITLHVDLLRGDNDHHRAEAAFKATALALRAALRINDDVVPSTKGTL
jgi:imidazoleglycerol phosphate dehydratase HisB